MASTVSVLEVGCGTGRNLPLYPDYPPMVGLDPDHAALQRARQRAPHVLLVAARVEALPFRDQQFNTVVSSLVFCSVRHPPEGLAEVRRVLATGGRLHMVEHVRHPHPWIGRMQDRLQPAWTWCTGGCHPNRATEQTVEQAGFIIDPTTRIAQGVLRQFTALPRNPS
jgi:ubiquinone/menaquinone biosynthesis C-methylase UbiE